MEKRRIINIVFLLFLVVLLSGCTQQQEEKKPSGTTILLLDPATSQEITMTSRTEVEQIETWKGIALGIATNCSYDVLKYNCWDYSTDLKRALVRAGYEAKILIGTVKCTSGLFDEKVCRSFGGLHNWVELKTGNETVWIEAITGQVITGDERQYYHLSGDSFEKYNPLKECIK